MVEMNQDYADLRVRLVDALRRGRSVTTPAVDAAFRTVPRHLFVPQVVPEEAYRDTAIPTRWAGGWPTSSSSQPAIMAIMVEQVNLTAGHRVLEIGAGTGYNAAILRELVGPSGQVVTIDIQADVAADAAAHLRAAGYDDVRVVTGDGGFGHPGGAPFDRIVVTAGITDASPHWVEQLGEGGMLVAPLRVSTMMLSVALVKQGILLRSRSVQCCGFMPLVGAFGADGADPSLDLGDELFLTGPGSKMATVKMVQGLLHESPRRVDNLIIPMDDFGLGGGLGLYLALEEPGMLDVSTTNPKRWGFHAMTGLLDPAGPSLCLVRRDAVVVYGTDQAAARMRARAGEWVEMGRPGVDRTRVELSPPGTSRRDRWTLRRPWHDVQIWFDR